MPCSKSYCGCQPRFISLVASSTESAFVVAVAVGLNSTFTPAVRAIAQAYSYCRNSDGVIQYTFDLGGEENLMNRTRSQRFLGGRRNNNPWTCRFDRSIRCQCQYCLRTSNLCPLRCNIRLRWLRILVNLATCCCCRHPA